MSNIDKDVNVAEDKPRDVNALEEAAKAVWDAKIAPGGGGRTTMPWPFCPEHDWCVETARKAVWAYMEAARFDSNAAESCENAFRDYIRSHE